MNKLQFLSIFLVLFLIMPFSVVASSPTVSAWIPYWAGENAVDEVRRRIRDLDVIMPFIYEVDNLGKIVAKADIKKNSWQELLNKADSRDVKVIPTIAWFDGANIHFVLSDDARRTQHIEQITALVKEHDFAGIDIDYESKLAITSPFYSLFLKELKDELGQQDLYCTVEARTPPESLYRDIPEPLLYANDYKEINKYCDRIEIMAYDQQRADIKLNEIRKGDPYAPVADTDWVEKVLGLALKDFDNNKVILGVPTYGRTWQVVAGPSQFKDYKVISSNNYQNVEAIAKREVVTPSKNSAGELGFSYFAPDSIFGFLDKVPTPKNASAGNEAASKALLIATILRREIPFNFISFSDKNSISDKWDLVNKYDLDGIALFSINGTEDKDLWDIFD